MRPSPFRVDFGADVLAGIQARLASTTLPAPRGEGWEHGASVDYLDQFRNYWLDEFDWDTAQERLNAHPQFITTIEGLRIHFYWVRGSGPAPRPLLLTHGWPGSVVEFLPAIDALTHPDKSGGDIADSFDLVVPSLAKVTFDSSMSHDTLKTAGNPARRSRWFLFLRVTATKGGPDGSAHRGGDRAAQTPCRGHRAAVTITAQHSH